MEDHFLFTVIILIATAVFIVATLQKLKLSPVLGYLIAGTLLGDNGAKVISFEQTKLLGELGVVFLLFAIGLELSVERLKTMSRYVFGLGSMQVLISSFTIGGILYLITKQQNIAIIVAGGLALSSTAVVMQVITENKSHATQLGRISLSILILQDLVVVPLLVVIPLLAGKSVKPWTILLASSMLKAIFVLVAIFITGRLLLRPLFSYILQDIKESIELPIALTLLVVLTAAWATEHFGLSLALGAFVSGVLVAETEFRITAEESINPFKSLLLGLFFMSVGMKIDVMEIYSRISEIITYCISLMLLKTIIITLLCMAFGFSRSVALHAGLLLSQGGEFAFILFALAKDYGVLKESTANLLLLVITCSMALTPLLAMIGQKIADKMERSVGAAPLQIIEYGARDLINHVIIAGFGKVGRMVANVMASEDINYIVVDVNDDIVQEYTVNGFPIFKGDTTQKSTLEALGVQRASAIVMTINNSVTISKFMKVIRNNFNNLSVIIKSKEIGDSAELYDLGSGSVIVPQNQEMGLQLGCSALKSIGISESEINRIKDQIRNNNYNVLTSESTKNNTENT